MWKSLFGASVLALSLVLPLSSYAATATVTKYSDSERYYIDLNGPIIEGDLDRIKSAYYDNRIGYATMIRLNSPGGNGAEMEKIAKWIRSSGIKNALVPSWGECYSACAVIWAAVENKYYQTGAKIGFHMPYTNDLEFLNEIKEMYGYNGLMYVTKQSFADAVLLYMNLPIKNSALLVRGIMLDGVHSSDFYMIDSTWKHQNIIGANLW